MLRAPEGTENAARWPSKVPCPGGCGTDVVPRLATDGRGNVVQDVELCRDCQSGRTYLAARPRRNGQRRPDVPRRHPKKPRANAHPLVTAECKVCGEAFSYQSKQPHGGGRRRTRCDDCKSGKKGKRASAEAPKPAMPALPPDDRLDALEGRLRALEQTALERVGRIEQALNRIHEALALWK